MSPQAAAGRHGPPAATGRHRPKAIPSTPSHRRRPIDYRRQDGPAIPVSCYTRVASPLGPLLLVGTEDALTAIWLPSGRDRREPDPDWRETAAPFAEAKRQLDAYFAGTLRRFDLRLAPAGTPFQRRVWRALCDIPYGETTSYGELARRIGQPAAVRAVGAANGQNPLSIVVPCHRVIGSDGRLVGYGGGLPAKTLLLDLERRVVGTAASPIQPRQGALFG